MLALVMLLPGFALAQTTGTGSYVPSGNFQGTYVPPATTLLGLYDSDSPGIFEGDNAWLGRVIDFTSIHTGQASEYDFLNSVGYVLQSSQYTTVNAAGVAGSRLVSVPLIWSGASLQSAAAGAYDSDYTLVAQIILSSIPAGPAPGQSVIFVRTGWEENMAGQMLWSSTGREAQFIGAFRKFVTAFKSVDPDHRFRFVWSPNVGGDPIRNSYPGDEFVHVMSMDFYYGLSQPTSAPDPDAAFQEMLANGLTQIADMATASNKRLAFAEWGVNQDNFGNYIKDFYDWCRTKRCLYVNYWNNDGDYAGKLSDGSYPETGAMFRHLFNPATYPVEPIAAPVGASALAGNGVNLITSNTVRSSKPITAYYLYKGASSGGESTTPVAVKANPHFTDIQANGVTAYYRIGAGNALSLGYLSAEVSATPQAPSPAPLPANYMAIASTGYAVSSTSSLVALSQSSPSLTSASVVALVTSAAGPNLIAGFPYGLSLGLDPTLHLIGFSRDYFSNRYTATSTIPVPFPASGAPEWVRVDIDAQGAVTTFYVAPVNGSAVPALSSPSWSQLGAPQTGQNHNGIYDAYREPFYVAGPAVGGGQLVGQVYDMAFYADGLLVAHPRFDARPSGSTAFTDGQSKYWTVGGGAIIH